MKTYYRCMLALGILVSFIEYAQAQSVYFRPYINGSYGEPLGQLIMDAGTVVSDLDLTGIAPGTYFIRVKFADGSIATRKIVKMP